MKIFFKKFWNAHPTFRKFAGVILVIIGLISIITPFTPVGFLLIVGLEILGLRVIFWDVITKWFKKKG